MSNDLSFNGYDASDTVADVLQNGPQDMSHLIHEIGDAGVSYFLRDDVLLTKKVGKVYPTEEQDNTARMMCVDLNSRFAHGGWWVVYLVDVRKSRFDHLTRLYRPYAPTKFKMSWYDADGDHQFNVICDDRLDVLLRRYTEVLEECQAAWENWRHLIHNILKVTPDQQYRAAKGETPPSQRVVA